MYNSAMHTLAPGWHQIVGHDWAVRLLNNAITHHRVGHAYLIAGPERIGKTKLGRTFAQALNCSADNDRRPCGECRACRLIEADKHPDVRLITPEVSERGVQSIKIEQVRRLQQDLSLSSYEAKYKIALLKRFDTANLNAANAFLKTLEEPPGNVILILTATDSDMMLPTINSRCRTINLRPIATELIEETLMTRFGVGPDEANLLANLADGRLGWAVSAHEDPAILRERQSQLDLLHQALRGSLVSRFSLAESLARKTDALPSLLRTWLSWWRDVALLAYGRQSMNAISNIDQLQNLHLLAARVPRAGVLASLKQTESALRQLSQNANARLVLENIMLVYPEST